jgi:hypothetical protein
MIYINTNKKLKEHIYTLLEMGSQKYLLDQNITI